LEKKKSNLFLSRIFLDESVDLDLEHSFNLPRIIELHVFDQDARQIDNAVSVKRAAGTF
jgi:hypothetical protein